MLRWVLLVRDFWGSYPCLLYGLSCVLGIFFGCFSHCSFCFLIPLFFLYFPLFIKGIPKDLCLRLFLSLMLTLSFFVYVKWSIKVPNLPKEGIEGYCCFQPRLLFEKQHFFIKKWTYDGKVLSFFTKEDALLGKNILCKINVTAKKGRQRPLANGCYWISGILKKGGSHFTFQPTKDLSWLVNEDSWSFSEYQFNAKQKLKKWINQRISNKKSARFLSGMITGIFDDQLTSFSFLRVGQQHLMAISGFHFSLLAALLNLFLSPFFSKRWTTLLMLFLMSAYFLFLGPSPSVFRAWLVCSLALFSCMLEKGFTAINALGVAVLLMCLFDPLICTTLGFQLSVVATLAILIYFPLFNHLLQTVFKKRDFKRVVNLSFVDQLGYCLSVFFRNTLALSLAVNVLILPLVLFYFQKFYWLSLIFNLFFPLTISLSIFLLFFGLIFSLFLPCVGNVLNEINSGYTAIMLDFAANIPSSMDFVWRLESFSAVIPLTCLSLMLFLGIIFYQKLHDWEISKREWLWV